MNGAQQADPATAVRQHNWPLLAGLRGFLALVVLATHIDSSALVRNPLQVLVNFSAGTAVWAFLIISGYSICHSITKQQKGFYARRVSRIMPVFIVGYGLALVPFLLGSLYPAMALSPAPDSVWNLALNILPIQTVFVRQLGTNSPAWSLGVECCLYALAPLILRRNRKVVWGLFCISALAHGSAFMMHVRGYSSTTSPLVVLCMAWAWLLGWIIYQERDNILVQRFAIGVGCAVFALNGMPTERLAMSTLVGVVGLLVFQDAVILPRRVSAAFNYAGELSYPLYITHVPLLAIGACLLPRFKEGAVFEVVAIACAALIYHAIDVPLRKRKKTRRRREDSADREVLVADGPLGQLEGVGA